MTTRNLKQLGVALALCLLANMASANDEMLGPFRMSKQTSEIVSPEFVAALAQFIPPDETLQWQVHVPESYSAERPAGVLVYLDSRGSGHLPDQWREVVKQQNLVWVGVGQMKRNAPPARRVWYAALGLRALQLDYSLDPRRLYIVGVEDTAGTALSTLITANEFTGALYVRGSYFSPNLTPEHIQAMQRKRHVFVTGMSDKNKQQVQSDYELYKERGIESAIMLFHRERSGRLISPERLSEAVAGLDGRL